MTTKEEAKKKFFNKFILSDLYTGSEEQLFEINNNEMKVCNLDTVWAWIEALLNKVEKEAREEASNKIKAKLAVDVMECELMKNKDINLYVNGVKKKVVHHL